MIVQLSSDTADGDSPSFEAISEPDTAPRPGAADPSLDPDRLRELLEHLRLLAARVRDLEPAPQALACFKTPTDRELADLGTVVGELVRQVHEVIGELENEILPRIRTTELDDVRFVARLELGELSHLLDRLDREGATIWERGLAATESLNRIFRVTAAIEAGLCCHGGYPRQISQLADTETAILVRRAYAYMWRSISDEPPETDGELEAKLRSAVTAIAKLRGREIFGKVRAGDVRAMFDIQHRVHRWLLGGGSREAGMQLWHDVVGFKQLLWQINLRAELIEHDARLLPELAAELGELEPSSRPLEDPCLESKVSRLQGRSPELDAQLEQPPDRVAAGDLLRTICEMEASFASRFSGGGGLDQPW